MISVRHMNKAGWYAVIDGMHRVTSLQELQDEKFMGVNYEQVCVIQPFSADSTQHHTIHWCRFGRLSTTSILLPISFWRSHKVIPLSTINMWFILYHYCFNLFLNRCNLGANESRDVSVANTSADKLFFHRTIIRVMRVRKGALGGVVRGNVVVTEGGGGGVRVEDSEEWGGYLMYMSYYICIYIYACADRAEIWMNYRRREAVRF